MKPLFKFLPFVVLIAITALSGCKKDEFYLQNTPELSVSANEITANAGGGVYSIDVESTRRWFVTSNVGIGDWFYITPIWQVKENGEVVHGGEDNGRINVTILGNQDGPRRATLSIETVGGLFRQVDILQQGAWEESTLILADDFGIGAPPSGQGPLVTAFTDWNRTGSSSDSVYYTTSGARVDVRGAQPSTGYPGASGGNNIMFAAAGGGVFYVNGIDPKDYQNFLFSFGTNQTSTVMSAHFSVDDGEWLPIDFTKTTDTWGLVETRFHIDEVASSLRLRIAGGPTQFGARIDDLRLVGLTPN
ncbi:MAG: BACON domain-containing protein [Bacteroidales bacterium]|nr:BACON domain-containing protein [Bacteroidales bacterium]